MRITLAPLLALIACGPAHVRLPDPPAADAPLDERWAWYQRFGPDAIDDIRVRGKSGMVHDHWQLTLNDGTTVEDPADLIREVPAPSATARAVQHSHGVRRARWSLVIGGIAMMPLGLGLAIEGAPVSLMFVLWALGAGAFTVGILAGDAIETATHAAFTSYDDDLRARLRLCVDGLRIVTCGDSVVPVAGDP